MGVGGGAIRSKLICVPDCFAAYPSQPYRDDSILSKPNQAYDWLHFHDVISSKVFTSQEWELSPYLCQPVLAFHHLFSTSARAAAAWSSAGGADPFRPKDDDDDQSAPSPFTGPRADYSARETEKHNRAILSSVQTSLSVSLARAFRSPEDIATDLLPYLVRLVTPDVRPVLVGGGAGAGAGVGGDHQRGGTTASVRKASEREMVRRAVNVMSGIGIRYERGKVEADAVGRPGGWVYRMEPCVPLRLSTLPIAPCLPGNLNSNFFFPSRNPVHLIF